MRKEKENIKNVHKYLAENNIQCDNLSVKNYHSVFSLDQQNAHLKILDNANDLLKFQFIATISNQSKKLVGDKFKGSAQNVIYYDKLENLKNILDEKNTQKRPVIVVIDSILKTEHYNHIK